ncbi:MAG: T9SS type A sorting domain-containing protein [Ignavibacteriaceae bacterium]|nr:T9SS type A sorting domain-containing protein [Ignavibacteriaceae bacterium]
MGTFYAISINGDLYTIDLSNGNITYIVDAAGSYSGITFHPQTNELWATSRAILPPNKDAVFKVNLLTGDTTIVGHTGLNQLTNDLVFGENLNLYGIVGTSSALNDFISVDPLTGAGTIIGSVGMKHILGLAYINSSPTSVENNNDKLPTEYVLMQNYPNPFNPSTNIKFAIPSNVKGGTSKVTLKIFDILGSEVATLVNEELSAGTYEVEFSIKDGYTSGVYFYQFKATNPESNSGKGFIQTKKMVLIK